MSTRDTYSVRLSTEEKTAVDEKAGACGMSFGNYMRYAALNYVSSSPPPQDYAALLESNRINSATLQTLATTSEAITPTTVAHALNQARAALGPREE